MQKPDRMVDQTLGVVPQGALFQALSVASMVYLAKGAFACSASVALMAVAAVTVLEYTRGLAGGACSVHVLVSHEMYLFSIPV